MLLTKALKKQKAIVIKEKILMKLSEKILIFFLSVSLIGNIGLIYTNYGTMQDGRYYTNKMGSVYDQNLSSLTAHCYDLEQDLSKLSVCSQSEQSIRILTDIIDDSGCAVTSLSTLPLYPEYVAKLNRYLNHVSDYSKYMLRLSASGTVPMSKCSDNINALLSSATAVNTVLRELSEKLKNTPMEWSELMSNDVAELDMLDNVFSSTMESIQTESIDYPTLIYDGPFSDSVVNKKINESGGKNVSESEAVSIFTKFAKAENGYSVYEVTSCSGVIETWCVTLEKDGNYLYGSISKKTGTVVSFINNGACYDKKISRDDAINVAKTFLESNGYKNMEPQYCQESNGNATINFVYKQDNVLIYPDMVKVRVDMCNSTVNGFEGMSYYVNHKEKRQMPLPDRYESIEETEKLIPNNLGVVQRNTAIIPTDGEEELLCYEYRCKLNNDIYILYYDASNQKQIKIFKVLSTENGDFVV